MQTSNINSTKKTDKSTDSIYDLGYYNSVGIIQRKQVLAHSALILFVVLNLGVLVQYGIDYINKFQLDIFANGFFNTFVEIAKSFHETNSALLQRFLYEESFTFPKLYIKHIAISLILAFLIISVLIYRVIKRSKFQVALSSVGLSQYYLKYKWGNTLYLAFKKGHKNQYTMFNQQKENLAQILGVDNLKFTRWRKNGVKVQITEPFPSVQDLANLKVEKFIQKNKLFLGLSLPKPDEKISKKELINKKYVARYINFKDLPHSLANLGSAGGGKSNTMNQYLYSIFYNFEYIEDFYFIDFKGGLEAQPFLDLEEKYQTGRIHIFDDDRLKLYKVLKKLYIINKSRMAYLKANRMKKLTSNFIFVIFDEMAEVLDYTATTKEEKKIKEQILFFFESLLRTMRSQGIKIFYSTQSYLSNASGLSSSVKNNTILKVAHQLGSKMQTSSIKDSEELMERGLDDPTTFNVGRNLVINEATNEYLELRSLYVPEDFMDSIVINTNNDNSFEESIKPYYEATIKKLESELMEDEFYPISELAKELGISYEVQEKILQEAPQEKKPESKKENSKPDTPKKSSFEEIKKFNQQQNTTQEENLEDFLDLIK